MKNKIIALLCTAVFITGALTGCSTFEEISREISNRNTASDTLFVQVQSIENNSVTAVTGILAEQNTDNIPAPPGGTPEQTDEVRTLSADNPEPPPQIPENDASGEMGEAPPDGTPPAESPAVGGTAFHAGTERVSFEITDSTEITVELLQGTQAGTTEAIVEDAVLEVTLDGNQQALRILVKNLSAEDGFGGSSTITNGTSANTLEEDGAYTEKTYSSDGDDENALRIDNAQITLQDVTIEKTGGESSNTEDGDFYGQNAALLVLNNAFADLSRITVTTSAVNGNGVFSYGEGTVVNISDSVIQTTGNNSGGIHTTGGGVMNASSLTVETNGNSAAAIRSDRGGGIVSVSGGTYTTNGTGSPAIYSTAYITVSDAELTATSSEAIVVEGENSVSLENCSVTGDMKGTYGEDSSEHIHGIMIYQSMSGDADVGLAQFSADGGSITTKNGDLFYVTNTNCSISLKDVALSLDNGILLSIEGNDASRGWGTAGSNGGSVTFTADSQQLDGAVHVDEISSLELNLANHSAFTGSINSDGQEGEVAVVLDDSSAWTLTADSYITSFEGNTNKVISNGFQLYVNGDPVN